MIPVKAMSFPALNDAELVGESVAGNRDAFGHIVARYQTVICSLAYSATGSLSLREDLAQETFVIAWKQLGKLREPAKLRPWLCSITRNLVNHTLRGQGREPSHAAASLESLQESHSPEPLPVERAISDEEAEILWRSLERIPEIYREPLVLFYREDQAAARVAQALELSEDAVHQRLARGRKLLQEQVLEFIEGTLKRTKPGKAFTLGVITVLPLLAKTTKAATAGATAGKSSAMVKVAGLGAFLQFILKVFLPIAPLISLGGYLGYKMGGDARQSPRQHDSVATFWCILVGCLVGFVGLPFLALFIRAAIPVLVSKEKLHSLLTIWLGMMYAVVPAALILWAWQRRRGFRRQEAAGEGTVEAKRRPFMLWVGLGVVGTACVLAFWLIDTNWKVQHLSATEVRKLVAEDDGKHLRFSILQYQNGQRYSWIEMRDKGKLSKLVAVADDDTLALLREKGMACPTYVQGRDFEALGWPGRFLGFLCIFILAMGAVVLLSVPRKINPKHTW
jgi:RNA polymerase sigma factor (sigma-70 family)